MQLPSANLLCIAPLLLTIMRGHLLPEVDVSCRLAESTPDKMHIS